MHKPPDAWKVLEHGPLEEVTENLWRVEGSMPKLPLRRNMIVARTEDGRLVIHNAIALDEKHMITLEKWGEPSVLIVPGGFHRLDAPAYKRRYPQLRVICPAGARERIEQAVAVNATYDDDDPDPKIRLAHVPGVNDREGVMTVESEDGLTLVFNDLVWNQPHLPGFKGLPLRLLGSTGSPRVTKLGKKLIVKDASIVKAELERLAALPDLRRVYVAHVHPVTNDPGAFLREAASTL